MLHSQWTVESDKISFSEEKNLLPNIKLKLCSTWPYKLHFFLKCHWSRLIRLCKHSKIYLNTRTACINNNSRYWRPAAANHILFIFHKLKKLHQEVLSFCSVWRGRSQLKGTPWKLLGKSTFVTYSCPSYRYKSKIFIFKI